MDQERERERELCGTQFVDNRLEIGEIRFMVSWALFPPPFFRYDLVGRFFDSH